MPDNLHHGIQLNADYEMSNVVSGNMVLMQGKVCRKEGGGGGGRGVQPCSLIME